MVTPSRPQSKSSHASHTTTSSEGPPSASRAVANSSSKRAREKDLPLRGLLPPLKKQTTLDGLFKRRAVGEEPIIITPTSVFVASSSIGTTLPTPIPSLSSPAQAGATIELRSSTSKSIPDHPTSATTIASPPIPRTAKRSSVHSLLNDPAADENEATGHDIPPANDIHLSTSQARAELSDTHVAAVAPSTVVPETVATSAPVRALRETMSQHVEIKVQEPEVPQGTPGAEQKKPATEARSLRSKDGGARHKSDLSKFFADFEDVMNDVPEVPDVLGLDEPILIVNEPLRADKIPTQPQTTLPSIQSGPPPPTPQPQQDPPPQPLLSPSAKRILIPVSPTTSSQPTTDPLPDTSYTKSHRRKENAEKRLRNIEKENALHEKAQLQKIYDDLLGPDWLKCLGIGAVTVTEGEKAGFEAKRRYFLREVGTLLKKFQRWKDEERRLRVERERAREEDGESSAEEEEDEEDENSPGQQLLHEASSSTPATKNKPPPSKQRIRLKINMPKDKAKPPVVVPEPSPEPSSESEPESEDIEDQSEEVSIMGAIVPRFRSREFALPGAWVSEEALRLNARKRRKLNRERVLAKQEEEAKLKARGRG